MAISSTRPAHMRCGLTVLELLTVLGIISLLTAVLLPAVSTAREAARRIECTNHLKQTGLALHCYHDTYRCLPAGWQWEATGSSAYGWAVALLPWLEQEAPYRLVDRNRPVGDSVNEPARAIDLPVLLCPSDIALRQFELFPDDDLPWQLQSTLELDTPLLALPTANYVGVFGTIEPDDDLPAPLGDGVFLDARPVRFAELQRGLSNTLLIGERTASLLPSTWLGVDFRGEDAACRLVGTAYTSPNCRECDECEFSSRHAGGANFLWGDGRVQLVSETIDASEYRRFARRFEF